MKKRLLCLVMILSLAMLLSGCGIKDAILNKVRSKLQEKVAEKIEELQETTETQDSGSKETGEEVTVVKPSEEVPEQVSVPSPLLKAYESTRSQNRSDEEKFRWNVANVKYTKVTLSEEDAVAYPALAKALEERNSRQDQDFAGSLDSMMEMYMEYDRDSDYEYFTSYEESELSHVLRADKKAFTLINHYYGYTGGVHGYYTVYGEAYDVESGKKLEITDVITDQKLFTEKLIKKLNEKYPDTYFFTDLDTYFAENELGGEYGLSWSMDYTGIDVYFAPYVLASYADGVLSARFTFAQDGDVLVSDYADVPEDYIVPITTWTPVWADTDGDGKEEEVNVSGYQEDANYDFAQWTVSVGNRSVKDPVESYDNNSYLIKKGDHFFIYCFDRVENDYPILSVIDVETMRTVGEDYEFSNYGLFSNYAYDEESYTNIYNAFVDPADFKLETRVDDVSTYSGMRQYHVGEDGTPQSDDRMLTVVNDVYLIKPNKDLPCSIVDKDGNIISANETLPAGTMLRVVRTSGDGDVDLQAGDYILNPVQGDEFYTFYTTDEPLDLNRGVIYRIHYEVDGYQKYVDGNLVYDLFEGAMYAG